MHGLGTQIIKKLVKKNKGKCDYYEDDNQFYCEIRWWYLKEAAMQPLLMYIDKICRSRHFLVVHDIDVEK